MSKPYSQPGEKGTDTNQASENELRNIISLKMAAAYRVDECGYPSDANILIQKNAAIAGKFYAVCSHFRICFY